MRQAQLFSHVVLKMKASDGFRTAKQVGPLIPDGLGRSTRARPTGIPKAPRLADASVGSASCCDSPEPHLCGTPWSILFFGERSSIACGTDSRIPSRPGGHTRARCR